MPSRVPSPIPGFATHSPSNIWSKILLSRESSLASGEQLVWRLNKSKLNPTCGSAMEAVLSSTKGFSNSEEFEAGRLNDASGGPQQLSGKAHTRT